MTSIPKNPTKRFKTLNQNSYGNDDEEVVVVVVVGVARKGRFAELPDHLNR